MSVSPDMLASPTAAERLEALAGLVKQIGADAPKAGEEVNNHVHSIYSFSPYNPTQIAWNAWQAGLQAVGIMDHDSISGAAELTAAGRILGMGTTCGMELRVSAAGTAMEGRNLNAPGSPGILYMAIHGIPAVSIPAAQAFLEPIHQARNRRNRAQVEALNGLLEGTGLSIDFERDVWAISQAEKGGSITERHILAALATKIIESAGAGQGVLDFCQKNLGLNPEGRIREYLLDASNPHYMYDLLGALKGHFLPRFFIQPGDDECIPVADATAFARSIGAIPAYAYLGDVAESPTGDKKAEKFEDEYLDELFPALVDMGFLAVTFMPPRNSLEQLQRLMGLCDQYGFMQISGVDINSSRQSFSCPEVLMPEFRHLNTSTWALIGHELLAADDSTRGIFATAGESRLDAADLDARIAEFARQGRELLAAISATGS